MVSYASNPTVDILMATYNGGQYLAVQIESILNQTFTDFQLIIADDCSMDSTREILRQYQKRDNRIKLIFNDINYGVYDNFQRLLKASTAHYFMFSDQDDVWHPNKVERSLDCLRAINADLVYSDLVLVDQNEKEIHPSFWEYQNIKPISGNPWKLLLSQNIATGCTIMANRRIKDLALPFPEGTQLHDWWITLIASIYGKIHGINDRLMAYRQHQENAIGAQKFLDWRSKTFGDNRFPYQDFMHHRHRYMSERIHLYQNVRRHIQSKKPSMYPDIDHQLIKLISYFQRAMDVSYFDFLLRTVLLKYKFPSQGIFRNMWWQLFLSAPIFAYEMVITLNTLVPIFHKISKLRGINR